jgi:hypothetical protein
MQLPCIHWLFMSLSGKVLMTWTGRLAMPLQDMALKFATAIDFGKGKHEIFVRSAFLSSYGYSVDCCCIFCIDPSACPSLTTSAVGHLGCAYQSNSV